MTTTDTQTRHHRTDVSGVGVFYREAGDPEAGAIVLLPGHPGGAHAYDGLTRRLAARWHVIAPDYPGYGFSATLDQALLDQPGRKQAAEALLWDYQNNPGRYPEFQAYLRERQPPLTAVWGRNDPFFIRND